MKCENKSKKSAVQKLCSPNVRPSAVCMTKCSLPPRKCWIKKYSKDFDGTLSDADCIKLIGIARNTYYKYKRELQEAMPV